MPHPHYFDEARASSLWKKFYVFEVVILGWGICLTVLYSKFFLKLVLRGEAHVPHLSNKVLIFEFVLLGWGTCFLKYLSFFVSLWLEVRHMPHPCETKFYVVEVLFCILWIFLSEKMIFLWLYMMFLKDILMSLKWFMCVSRMWGWRWYYAGHGDEPFQNKHLKSPRFLRIMDGLLHAMTNMCF